MKPAIRVENLSKLYRIGARGHDGYLTLRESLTRAISAPFRRPKAAPTSRSSEFWALNDISFELQQGEVLGVIGRNGAGKSTLLKILSRIVEPTKGRAVVHGRLGSLLEVGTGFHPELTGRENIYLNGSILGMRRKEISRKFDEIVAFAEIDQFLDTPVKRYSSGMYVRLAFGVAAHLEPEILVVDEVLAVGDAEFQRKCIGKMSEISRSDRTVLFVSHNMAVIQNLCRRTALLERGKLAFFGDTPDAIRRYMRAGGEAGNTEVDLAKHSNRQTGKTPIFRHLKLFNSHGEQTSQFACGEPMSIELTVDPGDSTQMHYGGWFEDIFGTRLFTFGTHLSASRVSTTGGVQRLRCDLGPLMLAPGQYHMTLVAGPIYYWAEDIIDQAIAIDVLAADVHGNGRMPTAAQGVLVTKSNWNNVPETGDNTMSGLVCADPAASE